MENELVIHLSKSRVVDLITSQIGRKTYESMDNEMLIKFLRELGYGENKDLPYYQTKIKIID